MAEKSFQEAVDVLFSLPAHTTKNKAEETKAFYEWLGKPGSTCRILHVAGTNGKGSVCAFLHSVLTTAGYRTGMFTSPHLTDIRERFVLDDSMIEQARFAELYGLLEKKLAVYRKGAFHPTFFESLFFLFMLWMEAERPEFVVLEAGIGGLEDVTNVVDAPLVTLIAQVGLDHCRELGNSRAEIAARKAGIFKKKVPAVCLEGDEEVTAVFVKKAQELSVPLTFVSEREVAFSKLTKNNIDFFMESAYYKGIKAVLQTTALYQVRNAALALRALELVGRSVPLTKEQIEAGFFRMCKEARMEEVLPGIFVDGANNPDGIRAFLESVAADGCRGRRYLLFSASADKDWRQMYGLTAQSGLFDRIVTACIQNRRSLTAGQLLTLFPTEKVTAGECPVFGDAYRAFCYLTRKKTKEDRIYVTGSLYLAGEIKCFAKIDTEV